MSPILTDTINAIASDIDNIDAVAVDEDIGDDFHNEEDGDGRLPMGGIEHDG